MSVEENEVSVEVSVKIENTDQTGWIENMIKYKHPASPTWDEYSSQVGQVKCKQAAITFS